VQEHFKKPAGSVFLGISNRIPVSCCQQTYLKFSWGRPKAASYFEFISYMWRLSYYLYFM